MRLLLAALALYSFLDAAAQTVLKCRIDNLKQGKVYLWNTDTNRIDSLDIINHSFEYSSELPEPVLFYIKFRGYNDWGFPMRMILSEDLTSMSLKELKPTVVGNSWRDIHPNKPEFIFDPNLNSKLFNFENEWQVFGDSINKLTDESGDDEMLFSKRKNLYDEFILNTEKFIKNDHDKIAIAVVIFEYLIKSNLIDLNKTRELFLQLDGLVKYSIEGSKIGNHINKELSVKIGEVAPSFESKDMNGNLIKLSQFQNKTVLLHFWSSTCGPCREENKNIKALHESNRNIVIINVSLDTNEDQWNKAVEKDGLSNMINTCDLMGTNNKIAQDYYIHGIPMHYLIDGKGRIIAKGSFEEVILKINGF
ncbi:MAG: TlpA disulfide reductase family protein [Cyclobacteriaceae bacterium]|nr:MAG: TlpA disulfide reductase family protein [Cyclobacteriaceae bacterium]